MSLINTETTITFKIPAEFTFEALADNISGHDKIETDNGNTIITFPNAEYKQIHYRKILDLVEDMRIRNPEHNIFNRLKSDIVQSIRDCERY